MTNEEALRIIKDGDFGSFSDNEMCHNNTDCTEEDCCKCIDEAFDLAYIALEKQIPKSEVCDMGQGWSCPNCGALIGKNQFVYCPECGQRLGR